MSNESGSIFRRYFSNEPFVDRFLSEPKAAIDVIVPVIHSNELWKVNLHSFYREIPINRLLIGDGGCIDDTIDVVKKFPRVVVFDHRHYKTIGYSERKLIEAVETEWFIHTHSDVNLPDGWFDIMKKYETQYDYYGCIEQGTILVEYESDFGERPWAGAQMVRRKALEGGLSRVEDDYIYRQGDFVYRRIIEEAGFKEGFIRDTFHYHQVMHRPSAWSRKVKSVKFDVELSPEEEVRTWMTQGKGIVKYLQPTYDWSINGAVHSFDRLIELKQMTWKDCRNWVKATNPIWWPYVRKGIIKARMKKYSSALLRKVYKSISRK